MRLIDFLKWVRRGTLAMLLVGGAVALKSKWLAFALLVAVLAGRDRLYRCPECRAALPRRISADFLTRCPSCGLNLQDYILHICD